MTTPPAGVLPARPFFKMSGSGNDFVFVDVRDEPPGVLAEPAAIQAICHRRAGVGADGVVFFSAATGADFAIRYHNSDGSIADLCGNASLCSVALARHLGIVPAAGDVRFRTDAGEMRGRWRGEGGGPEIDVGRVAELDPALAADREPGEERIGFARVGVPHVVVRCADVAAVPLVPRGRFLRHLATLPHGANVNFVARHGGRWRVRTYERGVEAETLACGTGAVATAALLAAWGESGPETPLETRSGRALTVRFGSEGASLAGEGRLVYTGRLHEVSLAGSGTDL